MSLEENVATPPCAKCGNALADDGDKARVIRIIAPRQENTGRDIAIIAQEVRKNAIMPDEDTMEDLGTAPRPSAFNIAAMEVVGNVTTSPNPPIFAPSSMCHWISNPNAE